MYNSEMENIDPESPTEPLDVKLVQPVPRCSDSPASLPPPGNVQIQVQAMNEEILHLRGQVALLQSQLASQHDQHPMDATGHDPDGRDAASPQPPQSPRDRSAYTSDDLCETAEIFEVPSTAAYAANTLTSTDDMEYRRCATAKVTRPIRGGGDPLAPNHASSLTLHSPSPHHTTKSDAMPVAKMAERVRLKRTVDPAAASPAHIGGTVCTTEMAEHLVADLLQPDNISDQSPQTQRWRKRSEHLELQNQILNLSLAESRSHTNRLYLLCGKYESNAVALHQALCCSDRAVEAYDVMLALLESRLAILEAADDLAHKDDAGKSFILRPTKRLVFTFAYSQSTPATYPPWRVVEPPKQWPSICWLASTRTRRTIGWATA